MVKLKVRLRVFERKYEASFMGVLLGNRVYAWSPRCGEGT